MDKEIEKSTALLNSLTIDDKLKNLSCPFTWGMQDVIENRQKLLDANDNQLEMVVDIQDNFPELILIYRLLLAYENVMSNDLPGATECINEAEQSLDDIKQNQTLLPKIRGTLKKVENVLEHIFVATKSHTLQKLKRKTEVDELLDKIYSVDDMNARELAMLSGCECLGWSLYYVTDNLMAIKCAEKAIRYESDNGKWHFLLGKNYRKLRRKHNSLGQRPSPQEASAFEKAFHIGQNCLFGVSLAQMYRESSNYAWANEIYKQVYDLNPTCCKVRLQLALGFIRAKQCTLAESCLDYVADKMPNSIIYTHYKAIFEEKCNRNSKAALPYYRSTTENSNFGAEWQYLECRKRVETSWDPLPYMLTLLEKYEKDSNHVIQQINVQIGTYYLFEKRDVLSACPYFIKAIAISPSAKLLKEHYLLFRRAGKINIYHVLSAEVHSALKRGSASYNDDQIAVLKEAQELCGKNCDDLPLPSSRLFSNLRNYGRGSSSRTEINRRQERSSASPRGFPRSHPQQSSSDGVNSTKKSPGSFHDKSDQRAARGAQSYYSLSTLEVKKDSASANPTRERGFRITRSSKPHGEYISGAEASCNLVKISEDADF